MIRAALVVLCIIAVGATVQVALDTTIDHALRYATGVAMGVWIGLLGAADQASVEEKHPDQDLPR